MFSVQNYTKLPLPQIDVKPSPYFHDARLASKQPYNGMQMPLIVTSYSWR